MQQIRRKLLIICSAAAIALAAGNGSFAASTGGAGLPSGGGVPSGGSSQQDNSAQYEAYFNQGIAAFVTGDFEEAEDKFKKAVKIKRREGDARAYLGMSQFELEDFEDAQENLEKAIKYETEMAGAWEKLGLIHLQNGDTAAAQMQLDELNEILAACSSPCTNEYDIQASIETLSAALDGANTEEQSFYILPEAPRDRLYRKAARLVNTGDYTGAISVLEGIVDKDSRDADAITYLGYSHRKLGAYDTAKSYYFAALDVDENHAGANEYLGELYAELGDLDKARAQLAKLDEICPFGCVQYDDLKSVIDTYDRSAVGG